MPSNSDGCIRTVSSARCSRLRNVQVAVLRKVSREDAELASSLKIDGWWE